MIPKHMALVPKNDARRAAMFAILDVEKRHEQGRAQADYPYARAFFRHLMGSKRITRKEINFFAGAISDENLRGNKERWASAIDTLISSQGNVCYLPLGMNDARRVFPEVYFSAQDRLQKRAELKSSRYSRQAEKEESHHEMRYLARVGQAKIDLAFQTPDTVSSWSSRWTQAEVSEYDLESMFFEWSGRFPELAEIERWQWQNEPLWALMMAVNDEAKKASPAERALARWMVPNKLTHKAA
ncbi:plasmid SOS inhibition protein A [Cedecea sp. P7760]|uniref:plasmid SOS inhibition protein A n=1 Tax=Cedecea sp. P7760 TaxID=2726983 RepID=UPI0015A4C29C|nr:plasmid SOS inhibition protein A [Cedecea sp. P7760]NWC63995.1 plasmid SOS inhibition protein A [Cedecea sp. P7760]